MAKSIWDGFGHRIGSATMLPDGKRHIYDRDGQPLGNVGRDGTFTTNSNLVSRTPMPGLLFTRSGKQRK